ncbi:hypothetical protein RB195_026230 [Necator americanus]|uniref:Uncharacterized protein n=1 Tax=Necator americanus TaxID=51031 RepID=A0ABR1EWG5_NECAM
MVLLLTFICAKVSRRIMGSKIFDSVKIRNQQFKKEAKIFVFEIGARRKNKQRLAINRGCGAEDSDNQASSRR